jgi:hypothetical protein
MKLKIKEIVKDNRVIFRRYRKGMLYYGVVVSLDDGVVDMLYEFPVPIEDCGDADFYVQDKAILFMRYIRKALDDGTFVKI